MATLQLNTIQRILKNRFAIDVSPSQMIVYVLSIMLLLGGSYVIGGTDMGILVVIGVLGIAFVGVIMARPQIGMFVLVIFIYTNMSTVLSDKFGIPSLNKVLVILIFVSVIGTQVMMRRKPLLFRITEAAILLFLFVVTVSTFIGVGVNAESFGEIVDSLKDFLLIFIIVQLAAEEKAWKHAQYVLIAAAVFLSAMTWYQSLAGDYQQDFLGFATSRTDSVAEDTTIASIDFNRVGGPVGDPNFYSQILLMVFPIALYRVLDKKSSKDEKLLALLATTVITGAIIFTYSRGALMALLLIIGLILLERKINVYKIGLVGLVVLGLAFPVLPSGYKERMLTIVGLGGVAEGQADGSAQGRLSESLVAIEMFFDNPILGIGYGQYSANYLDYSIYLGMDGRLQNREAHNLYLEAAAETGMVGLVALTFMFAIVFRETNKAKKRLVDLKREDLHHGLWLYSLDC
ncbi:MAG: O-antigen ligase family protein [Anaerolineae bacterium]|nr:O-antigen ligase family protein [Anaerolineae bacterium]